VSTRREFIRVLGGGAAWPAVACGQTAEYRRRVVALMCGRGKSTLPTLQIATIRVLVTSGCVAA